MEFSSLKQFKEGILEYSVLNGREIKFAKNDASRVLAECSQKCGFKILVSRVQQTHTFRLKTIYPEHKCWRVFANKNAKSRWVARQLLDKLKSSGKIIVAEVVDDIRCRSGIGITTSTAIQGRKLALKIVEGDAKNQYSLLWSYCAELKKSCNGNTCKIQVDRPSLNLQPRFGRFYVCFDGSKRAFQQSCRPFIGLDGCHLKNQFGGQLLVAVGRDPNDQNLPIAFAVVESKTKDSWRWFLTLLFDDIGHPSSTAWVILSDQQKGLVPCVEEMMEGCEHRFCVRHLYGNFKKKFGGGTLIRDLMMGAAKATYFAAWEEKMLQIKEINNDAYNWLNELPKRSWCKHAFKFHSKCDVLINNLTESLNSTLLVAKDKPILTMMEWIRSYLMKRFTTLRQNFSKHDGDIMPRPMKWLEREVDKSANWFAHLSGILTYEVTHTLFTDRFIVNLARQTCTCNFWDLVGIPCRHAVAALRSNKLKPEMFVHSYYKRDLYKTCYDNVISPINGQQMWPKTNDEPLLPPTYKRGAGRPKKLRRREPDEDRSRDKLRKTNTKIVIKCGNCKQVGHNRKTCKYRPPPSVEGISGPHRCTSRNSLEWFTVKYT